MQVEKTLDKEISKLAGEAASKITEIEELLDRLEKGVDGKYFKKAELKSRFITRMKNEFVEFLKYMYYEWPLKTRFHNFIGYLDALLDIVGDAMDIKKSIAKLRRGVIRRFLEKQLNSRYELERKGETIKISGPAIVNGVHGVLVVEIHADKREPTTLHVAFIKPFHINVGEYVIPCVRAYEYPNILYFLKMELEDAVENPTQSLRDYVDEVKNIVNKVVETLYGDNVIDIKINQSYKVMDGILLKSSKVLSYFDEKEKKLIEDFLSKLKPVSIESRPYTIYVYEGSNNNDILVIWDTTIAHYIRFGKNPVHIVISYKPHDLILRKHVVYRDGEFIMQGLSYEVREQIPLFYEFLKEYCMKAGNQACVDTVDMLRLAYTMFRYR